ncbi:MAG: dTDP-4-dehydrorhamnose reductase [Actinomycetota bacterium]|nr:dTDP-4-dehydrorhamnose reductase [Actinomycetota bacterium]
MSDPADRRPVLVTGAAGQLGTELKRAAWPDDVSLVALSSAELDITSRGAVLDTVMRLRPSVIVNAAAYTAVDPAEDDEDQALLVNATAVGFLAEAADLADALLIHVSTDYVFDGSKSGWYLEADPIAPIGAYGRTKAAGEAAALTASRSVVLRTAWVYSAHGSNFVKTMLRLAGERRELGVVADQFGCPTSATDIADVVASLVCMLRTDRAAVLPRMLHVTAPDDASWHQFAMAVFQLAGVEEGLTVRELTTAEYPTRAARPANSRLDSSRLAALLGRTLPPWRVSLAKVIEELTAERGGPV